MIEIKQTNLLYDDDHADCYYELAGSEFGQVAFVQCLDIKHGKDAGEIIRYWGYYNGFQHEESIYNIMCNGHKWPSFFSRAIPMSRS